MMTSDQHLNIANSRKRRVSDYTDALMASVDAFKAVRSRERADAVMAQIANVQLTLAELAFSIGAVVGADEAQAEAKRKENRT
jgi:hypothetical protein